MAKKLDPMDLKQIIRLHLAGLSNREISRNTINNYMQLFNSCDKRLDELLELPVEELDELISNKTTIDNERYKALMDYLEKEKLAVDCPGFTFQAHYFEYNSREANPYHYVFEFSKSATCSCFGVFHLHIRDFHPLENTLHLFKEIMCFSVKKYCGNYAVYPLPLQGLCYANGTFRAHTTHIAYGG